MIETYWCPGPWPWEWFRTCTREVPDPPFDPCKAQPCAGATAKLASARGRFNSACKGLQQVNAFSKLLQPILAAPVWMLVGLVIAMAVATLIGGPIFGTIAVIIFGLLVIYGIAWFLSVVVGKMAQSFATELNLARIEVTDAIKDVVASCPEQCRGDTSPPDCKLE